MKNWYLIENDSEYNFACARYEEIKYFKKGTEEFKEKLLLINLIMTYERETLEFPEVDPIELIKIRMKEFGYRVTDLATEYGDKGTISKVLNYKQSLSLTMIKKFSKMLRIPIEALVREYSLKKNI